DLKAYNPLAAAEFVKEVVPVSDTQIGPTIQWRGDSARYQSFPHFLKPRPPEGYLPPPTPMLETYSLSRAPPFFPAPPALISRALNSSRDLVGFYAAALYSTAIGDGLVSGYVETDTQVEPGCPPERCTSQDDVPDASVDVGGRIVTPRFGIGRLVFDAHVLN